jgi:hypothetical protein
MTLNKIPGKSLHLKTSVELIVYSIAAKKEGKFEWFWPDIRKDI